MGNTCCRIREDAFFRAILTGKTVVVQRLIDKVDPSIYDGTALTTACMMGHLDVVKVLLKDSRVDPSVEDNAALKWACWTYNYKYEDFPTRFRIIEILLSDDRVDPTAMAIEANKYRDRTLFNLLAQHPNTDMNKITKVPEWALRS